MKGKQIEKLNRRNEQLRMKEPVEELLFHLYRKAKVGEIGAKWLSAAQMLFMICCSGRFQNSRQNTQTLVTVLQQHRFPKRMTPQGITEYAVMEYSQEEKNAHAAGPLERSDKGMTMEGNSATKLF